MIGSIMGEANEGPSVASIAKRFHLTVATITREMCVKIRDATGVRDVVLSGGVFQNRLLLGMTKDALNGQGFNVWTNAKTPVNDGGVSLGQATVACERFLNRG
jgi:hydrogenase maturation protein HypF